MTIQMIILLGLIMETIIVLLFFALIIFGHERIIKHINKESDDESSEESEKPIEIEKDKFLPEKYKVGEKVWVNYEYANGKKHPELVKISQVFNNRTCALYGSVLYEVKYLNSIYDWTLYNDYEMFRTKEELCEYIEKKRVEDERFEKALSSWSNKVRMEI